MLLTKRNSLVHKIVDQLIVKESVIVFHGEVYFLVGPEPRFSEGQTMIDGSGRRETRNKVPEECFAEEIT